MNQLPDSVDISEKIKSAILNGDISPLEFAVKKKLIIEALESASKDDQVKSVTIDEIEKYGKQGATCLGATLTISERRTYQYDLDPNWKALKESISDIEDDIKKQEEKIKIACKNGVSLVSEDGEVIASIVPSPVTTSINVSFKKK